MDLGLCFVVHSSVRVWTCYFSLAHMNSWPGCPSSEPLLPGPGAALVLAHPTALPPACCAVCGASLGLEKVQTEELLPVLSPGCGKLSGFFECPGLECVWRSCSPNVPCPGTGNRQEEKPAVLTLQSPLMVRTAAGNAHKASREVGSERPSGCEDESSEHLWYPSFSPCPDTAASRGSGCTVSCQHKHSFRPKKSASDLPAFALLHRAACRDAALPCWSCPA